MAKNKITTIEKMPESIFKDRIPLMEEYDNQKEIIDLLKIIVVKLDAITSNTSKGY